MGTKRLGSPSLSNCSPAMVMARLHAEAPRQVQRWIVRGYPARVLGIYPWLGDDAIWIRIRHPRRPPTYFTLRQWGGRVRLGKAKGPPPWGEAMGGPMERRTQIAMVRLLAWRDRRRSASAAS